ncbi:hypothetical protein EXN66_Car002528 [Channa argus]|uniref:Uncharacterized protein n=1 Tax=Channa argus TaxID=215402 RepID=A0A6G1P9Z2_CHAAH|nr:hypothetical protein EXN66_Car002528 [Channa argus]
MQIEHCFCSTSSALGAFVQYKLYKKIKETQSYKSNRVYYFFHLCPEEAQHSHQSVNPSLWGNKNE